MASKSMPVPVVDTRSRILKDEDGTPLLRYECSPLTLPELPRRSGRRIRHYHEAVETQWRRHWETEGLRCAKAARTAAELDLRHFSEQIMTFTSTVLFHGNHLLCIRQDAREDAGDGHPITVCSAVTWDTRAGYPLPLSYFFPGERRWRKAVLDAVCTEGRRRLQSGEFWLDEPVEEALTRAFSPENFF